MTKATRNLQEDMFKFMITSRWIVLRMRNVSGNICRENQTHILKIFFPPENLASCAILWKNTVQPDSI